MTPPIDFDGPINSIEDANKITKDLTPNEKELLLEAIQVEGLPKLEKENFRIDSTGWKEIVDPNGLKVKENLEGDVWEYLEGDYKGEQLFTHKAAIRETKKVGKALPKSGEIFKNILEKKYKGNCQDFLRGENIKLSGIRDPYHDSFYDINDGFNVWCEDGSTFYGSSSKGYSYNDDGDYGFSVICIQD